MTDTKLWRRARDLFLKVVDRPATERSRILDRADGDERLRSAVADLLAADDVEDGMLDRPLALDLGAGSPALAEPLRNGSVLGAYRVVRRLGRGGSGSVYVAEREGVEFEHRVAIKVLHSAFERQALDRFRRERRILASLEHPSIARLIDGGSTPEGLPYVVMELVEGAPITEHCDRHQLALPERLQLLRRVCAAVEYSHRNLVVHRDLKPRNILVTESGDVKLLDFGIAKLLAGSDLLEKGAEPVTHGRWLSPGYASPEQVLGHPITTASDVYSLGVLLYELLTGRLPPSVLPVDLDRLESRAETLPPSVVVCSAVAGRPPDAVAADRSTTPGQLARKLCGDLDCIARRALRLEPRHRYGSAERLADDLGRYLEGRPVVARRGSFAYRSGKLLRRHTLWAATAGALAALVVGFAVVAGWQSIRLARERDVARQERLNAESVSAMLVDLFELMDPLAGRPHDAARKAVLDRGVERILRRFEDQPELLAGLMTEVAGIYRRLAYYPEAEDLLRRAERSRRRLLGDGHPDLADTLEELGRVLRERSDEGAEGVLREALEIRRKRYADDHPAIASALASLAAALRQRSDYGAAEALLRDAVAIDEDGGRTDTVEAAARLTELGVVVGLQNRREEARQLLDRALTMARRQVGPQDLFVADILNKMGVIEMGTGHFAEAEAPIREALDIRLHLLGGEHPMVAAGYNNLAGILDHRGHHAEAESLYRRSLALDLERLGENHAWTAQDRANLGLVLWDLGRLEEAEEQLRRSLAVRRELFGDEHADVQATLNSLALVIGDQSRPDEAEALIRESLELLRQRPASELWRQGDALVNLARVALVAGRFESARRRAEEALEIFGRQLPEPVQWLRARAKSVLGAALLGLGEEQEAERLLVAGYRDLAAWRGGSDHFTIDAAERLARFFEQQGRDGEARSFRGRRENARC